jgi:hypothetical protein
MGRSFCVLLQKGSFLRGRVPIFRCLSSLPALCSLPPFIAVQRSHVSVIVSQQDASSHAGAAEARSLTTGIVSLCSPSCMRPPKQAHDRGENPSF